MGKTFFTMDIWSDPDRKPYMAVTAHWIEHQVSQTLQHKINLRVDLIGFLYIPDSHTGKCLAEAFLFIIDCFDISNKVSFRFNYYTILTYFIDWMDH